MREELLTDAQALLLHRELAKYHAAIAAATRVATRFAYHDDLAWRCGHEADRIQDEIVQKGLRNAAHSQDTTKIP